MTRWTIAIVAAASGAAMSLCTPAIAQEESPRPITPGFQPARLPVTVPRLPGPEAVQRQLEDQKKANPWKREFRRPTWTMPSRVPTVPVFARKSVRPKLPPRMDPLPHAMDPLPRDGVALPGNNGRRLVNHPEPARKWATRNVSHGFTEGLTRAPAADAFVRDRYAGIGVDLSSALRPPAGTRKIGEFNLPAFDALADWYGAPGTILIEAYGRSARGSANREFVPPYALPRSPGFANLYRSDRIGIRGMIENGAYATSGCASGTCIAAPAVVALGLPTISLAQNDAALAASYNPAAVQPAAEMTNASLTDVAAQHFVDRRYAEAAALLKQHLATESDDLGSQRALGYALLLSRNAKDGIAALSSAYITDPTLATEPLDLDAVGVNETQIRNLTAQVVGLANRTKNPSAFVAAAALMQARGRNDLATKMVENAKTAGLEAETAAQLVQGFAPAKATR